MKALAVDLAVSKLTVSAKNEDHVVTAVYDIGMKQSETLLPAIDYVLQKADLTAKALEYLALCQGPGSFTGLRLSFAALKAIQIANNIPLYGISTLDVYAEHYKNLPFTILSCIDAKKERFYAKAFLENKEIFSEDDYTVEKIIELMKEKSSQNVLICGTDAELLHEKIKDELNNFNIYTVKFEVNTTDQLFKILEEKIKKNEPPLNDYDGPVYLRASEAEVKLNN